jgi:hypothetical protein
MLQSFPVFTVARRIRQTIAKLMFPVSEPLAVLPILALVPRGCGVTQGFVGSGPECRVGLAADLGRIAAFEGPHRRSGARQLQQS